MIKSTVRFNRIVLAFQNCILGGAAHAKHQSPALNQAENGNSKVQCRKAIGTQSPGNKKSIRQNIARKPDHSEHI
ncbi:hypothetical protein SDC9_188579 [bioreactor metagenome]|uniref:Uncharacterized protein n=1 Tax=bioreactor metagenome TaxID=1076179 RepID=A0A645HS48_9ZZZZ